MIRRHLSEFDRYLQRIRDQNRAVLTQSHMQTSRRKPAHADAVLPTCDEACEELARLGKRPVQSVTQSVRDTRYTTDAPKKSGKRKSR